jgi:WD40 repeat protein/serine/threonine protein kinase
MNINDNRTKSSLTQRQPFNQLVDQMKAESESLSFRGRDLPFDFGDFRLVRKIGEGGMGIVYEAEQKSLGNRRLALKIIKYSGDPKGRMLNRFRTEVEAVAQLEHRHIVPVYHVGEEAGKHFYAMKFIEGDDLRQLIRNLRSAVSHKRSAADVGDTKKATTFHEDSTHRSGWSKIDTLASNDVMDVVSKEGSTAHPKFVSNFVRMGIQVATALHHVHQQGVVHRDIKPANLLLDVDGDVWLTDFGLARIRGKPSGTVSGALIGTYHYMSPEQAMGSRRVIVDHRTDIYSLGVTMYELLTLKRAFTGRSQQEVLRRVQFENPTPIRTLTPRVPKDLETIVMKAMAKDPGARFQSAAEMAAELRRFQAGKPLTIRRPSLLEKLGYWARANRQAAAAAVAVLLVTFAAAVITAFVSTHQHTKTQDALEAKEVALQEKDLALQTKNKALQSEQLALQSERDQRNKAERELRRSEGLRAAANSLLQVDQDPTLALLLGVEGAKLHPGADAHDAIVQALDVGHEAHVLKGHTTPVGHVSFNHDGTKVVSSAAADTSGQEVSENADAEETNEPALVWDTTTGQLLGRLQGEKTITSAVFSPDKYRILTTSSPPDSKAAEGSDEAHRALAPRLWDGTSFEPLVSFENAFLFKAHPEAFSPDGRRIVLPTLGNQAAIFDCVGGIELRPLVGHEASVVFAAFSPKGDQVVTYSRDNTVRIWDSDSGDPIHVLDHWRKPEAEEQEPELTHVAFSAQGDRLLTASRNHDVELWDLRKNCTRCNTENAPGTLGQFLANGDLLAAYGIGESKLVLRSGSDASWLEDQTINVLLRKAVVSPDSRTVGILTYTDLREFHLWDLERREMRATLGSNSNYRYLDLAFSPDSTKLATACEDKNVRLWHVANGRERATYPSRSEVNRPVVAPSADGKSLAIASTQSTRVGAFCDLELSSKPVMMDSWVTLPHPGGKRLLVTGDRRVAIHSIEDGRFTGAEARLHRDIVDAAINLAGDRVAVFCGTRGVLLWSPDTNRRLFLPVGTTFVNQLAFSPDGRQLFAISDDATIRVWDSESGEVVTEVTHPDQVRLRRIVFSPDAKYFAVATNENAAALYDAASFELIRRFRGPGLRIDRIQFSFDAKKLISYGVFDPSPIVAWDIESGEVALSLEVAGKLGVAMHPNQPEALVWSNEEGAVIWRYEENVRIPVTDDRISSGAFSPDGNHFYLGSWAPAVYEVTKFEDWPERLEQPKVTRWTRDGLQVGESIDFPNEAVYQIRVSEQGSVLINALRWNQIDRYDIATHELLGSIPGHFGRVTACLHSSDSKRLITTSWDAYVSIWNTENGEKIISKRDQTAPILDAAASREDRYLVAGTRAGTCLLWSLPDLALSHSVPLSSSPIVHVSFDPNANRVLALSGDNRAHLLQRDTGELVAMDWHSELINWAEFSPDGKSILVVPRGDSESGRSKEVLIVPIDGSAVTRLDYEDPVVGAHFHPDSARIVTTTKGEEQAVAWIQDYRSGRIERKFTHDGLAVPTAVFDPEGNFVLISAFDGGTVWRVSDGRRWLTIESLAAAAPWNQAENPFTAGKPRRLITRRFDNHQYREWPLDPLRFLEGKLPRSLTERERRRFLIGD